MDVTVPFDGEDNLTQARVRKQEKYAPLKQWLMADHEKGYETVHLDTFVVGSLGSWDTMNEEILTTLLKFCSSTVTLWTVSWSASYPLVDLTCS